MSKSKKSKKGSSSLNLNGVLVLQLVIMLGLSLFITSTVSNRTRTNSIEHLGAITDERAHIIENYIDNAEKTLTAFSKAAQVKNVCLDPSDADAVAAAQKFTENYSADIDNLEGIYISQWDTKVLAHTNAGTVGMVTRKDPEPLKALQDSMLAAGNGVYDTGIIISPASGKQIVSMYKAVYGDDGKPIGLVGLGIYTDGLIRTLDSIPIRGVENSFYSMVITADNKFIFNEDSEKIGTEVTSSDVLALCAKFKDTDVAATDYFEYKMNGKGYVSIYSYMPKHGWILMIDDNTSEAFALTNTMRLYLGIFGLIILGLILVFNAITRRQAKINQKLVSTIAKSNQAKKSLNLAMFNDVLTDAKNRISFALDIEKASPNEKKPCFFAFFNICEFSEINTKFGNDAGDQMLVHTADILRETFPEKEIYRTGSDEFVLMIPAEENNPSNDALLENVNYALRRLMLPFDIENAGTVYPKYKISVIKKSRDLDMSALTTLKDMTNKTGEATHGMIDFKDWT